MNYKQASLDTALLYQSAVKAGDQEFKRGRLEVIDMVLEELNRQESEGYRKV